MNKPDLALNNLKWLMCLKTKPNQTKQYIKFNKYFCKSKIELNNQSDPPSHIRDLIPNPSTLGRMF